MYNTCSIILISKDKVILNPRLQPWVICTLKDSTLYGSKPQTAFHLI